MFDPHSSIVKSAFDCRLPGVMRKSFKIQVTWITTIFAIFFFAIRSIYLTPVSNLVHL